jgi:hypothetical protein
MALDRLTDDLVYRFYLASPLAFVDWQTPTSAELNINPTNAPGGLVFNITCALDTASTTFDLEGQEMDESTTFCQIAGAQSPMSASTNIVLGLNMAKERWTNASSVLAADGFNTSTLAQSLLAWRGVDWLAIMSVGEGPDAVFAPGHRIKMAEISTDYIVPEIGTGENIILSQTTASRTNILWNYELAT